MAFVTRRLSDVSGQEIPDDKVVTVVIKGATDEPKVADTTQEELKALKTVNGLCEIEVRDGSGQNYSVFATKAELLKFIPAEKLEELPGNRGRRPGYKPGANGNAA